MNKDIDEIKCIVCNKSIKRGAPGTCMHETGFDHHLKCTFTPEMEQAIQDLITKAKGCVDCKKLRCENCERLWQT